RIRLWDAATGKALATCDTKVVPQTVQRQLNNGVVLGLSGGVFDAAFSPDGRTLASCLGSGQVGYLHLWDVRSGRPPLEPPLKVGPRAVAFSRDGPLLAAAGAVGDFDLRVWDVKGLTGVGAVKLDAARLAALWADLAAADLAKGLTAERTLAAGSPAQVLPLLQEKLQPVKADDEETRKM